jgi:adenylate cyclase class 2
MTHTNIEIKARCPNPEMIREILNSENAEFRGLDHQVDTYFNMPKGRFKLREGTIENAFIYYQREDKEGPKQSDVLLSWVQPGTVLKEMLANSLGILTVVDKQREIYFVGNVKFHLDEVMGLGSFVEIEAIDADGTIGTERLNTQCQHYLDLFNIQHGDLISISYSDMLLNMRKSN